MTATFQPPAGSNLIAHWAAHRGFPYQPSPAEAWYRQWEPFQTLVSPARYHNAVRCRIDEAQIIIAEPWMATGDSIPLGRTLLAFISTSRLQYRAAARASANFMTRVSYLGAAPPRQQHTGDVEWDDKVLTFAETPLEAVRAFPPSLRKLLLSWKFEGHLETRQGGMVFHLADALPIPADYERVLGWLPIVLEKAAKQHPVP